MSDNKYSFEENQLSENSQLTHNQILEGLAAITNFEKDSSSKFPEIEGQIDQEVEDVFNLLLLRIIALSNVSSLQRITLSQQVSKQWNNIAPTFLMQLSLIGYIFCILAAIVAKLISPLIAPAATYLLLGFCFLVFFAFLWQIRWFRQFKSSEQEAKSDFQKYRDKAVTSDWEIITEIIETANYKKKVLQYVENKVQAIIEKEQERSKGLDKLLKVGAIFIIAVGIIILNPGYSQILANNVVVGNISAVSASLAILWVLGSGIVIIYGFIFESRDIVKISTYKTCLYLLKQAQLVVDSK